MALAQNRHESQPLMQVEVSSQSSAGPSDSISYAEIPIRTSPKMAPPVLTPDGNTNAPSSGHPSPVQDQVMVPTMPMSHYIEIMRSIKNEQRKNYPDMYAALITGILQIVSGALIAFLHIIALATNVGWAKDPMPGWTYGILVSVMYSLIQNLTFCLPV